MEETKEPYLGIGAPVVPPGEIYTFVGSLGPDEFQCTIKALPDITINVRTLPSRWNRFWTRLFFGTKWSKIK